MKLRSRLLLPLVSCGLLAAAHGQIVYVALEQHNQQTGASSSTVTEYVAYATVEGITGVTGATVTADSGAHTGGRVLPQDDDDDSLFEGSTSHSTVAALVADSPTNGEYVFTTTGTVGTATINGPGGLFSAYNPATPLFTIENVTGTWVGSTFYFDPASVTGSFTVKLSSYSVATSGGHYGSFFQVADVTSGYSGLGEVGTGPDTDDTPFTRTTFTFTKGAALTGGVAGDGDETTYGFTNGTRLELEGGFFNIYDLKTSGIGGADQAFMFGNVTSFTMVAGAAPIPEPSTYAAIFGALALVGVAVHRRRRA